LESLPDAELDVLASLWAMGTSTAREVRERLTSRRPMSHASAFTLLRRLAAKGLVAREKSPVGKAFLYTATVEPEVAYRRVVQKVLERVFGGSGIKLVTSLFESAPPTGAELDQLQRILDEYRKNSRGKGRSK